MGAVVNMNNGASSVHGGPPPTKILLEWFPMYNLSKGELHRILRGFPLLKSSISHHKIRARMHTCVLQGKLDVLRCSGNIPSTPFHNNTLRPRSVECLSVCIHTCFFVTGAFSRDSV